MASFLNDNEFNLFKDLIYTHSGLCFSNTNRPILESRLKERLKEARIEKIRDYHRLILRNDDEMKILLDSGTSICSFAATSLSISMPNPSNRQSTVFTGS
jgi:chemotaxis protein methyltransferase CheR